MNTIIRVASISSRVKVLDPAKCCDSILAGIDRVREDRPDILVFPGLALTSASCGSFFKNRHIIEECQNQLYRICEHSREMSSYLIIGMPIYDSGSAVDVCAVLYEGKVLGYVRAFDGPEDLTPNDISDALLPPGTVFSCGDVNFCVLSCNPKNIPLYLDELGGTDCDLMVVPSCHPVTVGDVERVRQTAAGVCGATGCGVVLCGGGYGDTSSPFLYTGFAGAYEGAREIEFACEEDCENMVEYDFDADILKSYKQMALRSCTRAHPLYQKNRKPFFSVRPNDFKRGFLRHINLTPFIPEDALERRRCLEEYFALQVKSLAVRMANTGLEKLVLGLSGGLDSTLALLVCVRVCDRLSLPHSHVIAVTMPGFGTSDRTYYNALRLIEELGCTGFDIPIRQSVTQHFADIGHDPEVKDATYENAQARERAQILFDLANQEGGLVVGTGDLSEAALGFCTFCGDQAANYNVNICIPKTLIRIITGHMAHQPVFEKVREILDDILDTPISPELLPPDEEGNITQKTEEILGEYDLHDFFLYYFLKYEFSPYKLYYYACVGFSEKYDPGYIKDKLKLFFRRLFQSQFKRSSAPDSAIIGELSFNGVRFRMPSDGSPESFIAELDTIDFSF